MKDLSEEYKYKERLELKQQLPPLNNLEEVACPSCKKEQKLTCPICQEDKKHVELIYGDNCSHSICCRCFCNSFSSTPIVDCPLCRQNFKKTHWRTRHQNPN